MVAARIEASTVTGPVSVVVNTPSDQIVLADTSIVGQLRFPPASACYRILGFPIFPFWVCSQV